MIHEEDEPQLKCLYLRLPSSCSDEEVMNAASALDDLEDGIVSASWEKDADGWLILWVVADNPDLQLLISSIKTISGLDVSERDFSSKEVPQNVNWLEESYRSFPPFQVGNFFIYGSHYDGDIPQGTTPLQIDAATAFGSGEHGTTAGCLQALIKLHSDGFTPQDMLDMGSGSGILAIAAWKLWEKPVFAVDVDDEATIVAERHREINHVPAGPDGMQCSTGDGYQADAVTSRSEPFDLIIANILAGPLISMAPDLAANLAEGGRAVLSGLLLEQQESVQAAHEDCGLKCVGQFPIGEWQTLILQK